VQSIKNEKTKPKCLFNQLKTVNVYLINNKIVVKFIGIVGNFIYSGHRMCMSKTWK
jgi:hypothetical protein